MPLIPDELLARADESADELFYAFPRLVAHIDPETIAELTAVYRELVPEGGDVLDLMSSWISHLPEDVRYRRVAGLGMNAAELAANPRLDDWAVQDLNREPELPYADASFDAVLNAVSIQYLVRAEEVYRSVRRVLRPGGVSIVALSHRCFPTKAIRAFHVLAPAARLDLVSRVHADAGFGSVRQLDRSPGGADPLWLVVAR